MALQSGRLLARQLAQNRYTSLVATVDKLCNPFISSPVAHRKYSRKSKDPKDVVPGKSQDPKDIVPASETKNMLEKAKKIAAQIKETKRRLGVMNPMNVTAQPSLYEAQNPPRKVDIIIVGGGVMGSSIAYHLTKDGLCESILVIEKDPMYTRASSVLSVGGIRQQFSIPENIRMSMYSAQFLRESKYRLTVDGKDLTDVQFNHQGYLFLASEEGAEIMESNHKIQKECGASVELMSPTQLKEKFPWVNTDGIVLASYGLENEGWFDPWSLLKGFRSKAVAQGARFLNGEVLDFNLIHAGENDNYVDEHLSAHGRRVRGVKVKADGYDEVFDVDCSIIILAAGHDSGRLGRLMGIGEGDAGDMMDVPIPVEPRKRYVYVVHSPDGPTVDCPLLVDPCGAYFRREGFGGNYLCGISPGESEEPPVGDLDYIDYDWFEEKVWPKLAHRVPAFENLKVKSAWAGYYDYNTIDQNAIVGMHPAFLNLYLATGFSGHGIQQAPAVGQYIRDLVYDGGPQDLDLSRFGFERFVFRTPLQEACVV